MASGAVDRALRYYKIMPRIMIEETSHDCIYGTGSNTSREYLDKTLIREARRASRAIKKQIRETGGYIADTFNNSLAQIVFRFMNWPLREPKDSSGIWRICQGIANMIVEEIIASC